ncbi:hypothetical protein CRUP_019934 [Coryphaenoides rupestris]|nr:hypothetical protein CRUP_019934 [Coryphaenoides rupestris]
MEVKIHPRTTTTTTTTPPPSTPGSRTTPSDLHLLEVQLDFFRKLGYSAPQVRAVMQKLGGADTDRLLGELVRGGPSSGTATSASSSTTTATTTCSSPSGTSSSGGASELLGSRGGSSSSISRGPGTPEGQEETGDNLRPIVIDGSNVAMSHGNKEVFSCLGIQLAVNFFLERGHADVIVFVPLWRKEPSRPDVPISGGQTEADKRKILVFTPSRRVAGKRVVCYDDRFIVKEAYESAGVIVSNDSYRDLQGENPEWKRFIEDSLLMYFFVNDKGAEPSTCLCLHSGRKCTYGIKCKFHHPERGHQSNLALADELREKLKPPSSSSHHHPISVSSGGPSGTLGWSQGLSLEEEMAKKFSLHHHQHSSGTSSRKGAVSENVVVKGGPHSGQTKRHASRKEKAHHPFSSSDPREPLRSTGSQVQLDSGLGSIETQLTDVSGEHSSCCHYSEECYGLSHPALSQGHQYFPACSRACSCCYTHAPPPLANPITTTASTTPPYPHHHHHPHPHPGQQHHSMGPPAGGAHHPDMMAYGPARYLGYGPSLYPMSVQAHSHPTDFQNRRAFGPMETPYRSDPYATYGVPPGERPPSWGYSLQTPPAPASPPAGGRETVRKKLLAIFNSHLVDRAMEMFPSVMDPQVLVAEIIVLQSQDRARR